VADDAIAEDRSLELQGPALRRLIDAAAERVVAHIASLPDQPSADVDGGAALARSLAEPMPETGTPADELLDLLFERVIPKSFNTAGPGYLAYIPGGGLPHSAVADLISAATNRYVGVFAAARGSRRSRRTCAAGSATSQGCRPPRAGS
jgi:aromatic-L-amino-acid decarboxylase